MNYRENCISFQEFTSYNENLKVCKFIYTLFEIRIRPRDESSSRNSESQFLKVLSTVTKFRSGHAVHTKRNGLFSTVSR